MEGIQTTSIDALPQPNVELTTTEKIENPQIKPPSSNNDNINNELVSGIQQASANGGTMLPTRDIPIDQSTIVSDENIKPNHIPQVNMETDYITKHQTSEEIIRQNKKKVENANQLDTLFNELNLPILISCLFFIFQLPFVQKQFLIMFSFGYTTSGNIKLIGRLLQSICFGLIVYVSNRIVLYLNL